MLDTVSIECPWCGERFRTAIDASAGSSEYVEDCQVCCSPIVFHVEADGEGMPVDIRVSRE